MERLYNEERWDYLTSSGTKAIDVCFERLLKLLKTSGNSFFEITLDLIKIRIFAKMFDQHDQRRIIAKTERD